MSRKCDVCGKGALKGNKISHSNIKTKTEWSPNLQKVRAKVKGKIERLTVCTRCIRSGKVEKAV